MAVKDRINMPKDSLTIKITTKKSSEISNEKFQAQSRRNNIQKTRS